MVWLLRASWQASILILMVLAVQYLFRRHLSPKWRYRLWLLVLVRLVLPVSPASHFSVFNYVGPQAAAGIARISKSTSGESSVRRGENQPRTAASVKSDSAPGSNSLAKNTPEQSGKPVAASPDLKPARRIPSRVVGSDSDSDNSQTSALRTLLMGLADYSFASQCLMVLLLVVWPAGVVILVLKILRQNLGFAVRVMRAPPLTDRIVLDALEDCKRLLDIDFPIPVVENRDVKTPALYGFFRPRLLLPQGLAASFSVEELKYIFLHELGHIKRLDMAVNWLMTGLQILHWFNPLIWVGFARIRADRELACDALVLSRVREAENESYGQTVIKLLESFIVPPRVSGLVGLLEEKHEMKRRITMIAHFKRATQVPLLAVSLVVLLGLVSLTDATVPEPRMAGLAGWWHAQGDARDSIGRDDGLLEGAMSFNSGKSFNFNGLDADVKIPASGALDVGRGTGYAVAAWIDPEKVDIGLPLIEWNSGSMGFGLWIIADFGPGGLYAEMMDEHNHKHAIVSPSGILRPHTFQHVAFTYERQKGMGALYVNGELAALTFIGNFAAATDGDVYLGLHPYGETAGERYSGSMRDVQIFNTLISASDVRKLYQDGAKARIPQQAAQ
jgi:beta-lactamase regulating signal transducer with metallopeptidase domain